MSLVTSRVPTIPSISLCKVQNDVSPLQTTGRSLLFLWKISQHNFWNTFLISSLCQQNILNKFKAIKLACRSLINEIGGEILKQCHGDIWFYTLAIDSSL